MDILAITIIFSLFIYSIRITKKWTCSEAKVRSFENKLKLKQKVLICSEHEYERLKKEYLQSIAENEELRKNIINSKN